MTKLSLLNMAPADVIAEPQTISRRAKSDSTNWQKQRRERNLRLEAGSRYASGKMVTPENVKALLDLVELVSLGPSARPALLTTTARE